MRDWDQDWELLNVYADGELDRDECAVVKARLLAEPDLRHEMDRIQDLKRQLASLRPPEVAAAPLQRQKKNAKPRSFAAAMAAALAIVTVGIGAMLVFPSAQSTWLDKAMAMHDRLSQATYVVEEVYVAQLVSSGHTLEFRAPDLTESRLYLVDVMTSPSDGTEAIAMHYRGMRGCRLTVVAMYGAQGLGETPMADTLIRTWSYGEYNFAVIARGMDLQRFSSVVEYLQAAIEDDARWHKDLQIAMGDRYNSALPCA